MLLLCDDRRDHAGTVLEHIEALQGLSRHRVYRYNPRGTTRNALLNLDEFDVVVIHYTLFVLSEHYLPMDLRDRIARFRGLKVQYIQDDYRQVDDMAAMIRHLGIDVLLTLVPPSEIPKVWTERLPGVRTLSTLAGYVPSHLRDVPPVPLEERWLDVGYRGRTLPYWIGELGQEKVRIARGFLAHAGSYGLRCDIAWDEESRIYGTRWLRFISSCRVTLGTESGASITDFDGSVERGVREYLAAHPDAGFEEVQAAVLAPHEWNVRMNVISPRIFEAAALRTGLVLFPGSYLGVLEPGRHYIELAKDFSNLDEVVERIRDDGFLLELTERAHADLVGSGAYCVGRLVEQFDGVLDEHAVVPARTATKLRYRAARAERLLRAPGSAVVGHRRHADAAARIVVGAQLVLSDPSVRRLAALAPRHVRPGPRALAGLTTDLVRLAILRRAQKGGLAVGPAFIVEAELDEIRGSLLLSSRPPTRRRDRATNDAPEVLLRTLREDRLLRCSWNHSAVGSIVPWFWGPVRARFPVDPASGGTTHGFESLLEWAGKLPAETARALTPLVRDPSPAALEPLPEEAPRLPLALHALRHADNYLPKAFLAFQSASRHRDLRRLLVALLRDRDLRRAFGIDVLLAESVKLHLLAEALAGRLPGTYGVDIETAPEGVVFRSRPRLPGDAGRPPCQAVPVLSHVSRLIWDHSRVSSNVEWRANGRSARVALDPKGVFEFQAIARWVRDRGGAVLVQRVLHGEGAAVHDG